MAAKLFLLGKIRRMERRLKKRGLDVLPGTAPCILDVDHYTCFFFSS
jgi:predicted nuclease with RNAse H fold